jgi:alcohol dehydrogenase class IV
MNKELTAATGMDALVHAIEAYVSNASSPVTDLHALEAVRLIYSNIQKALKDPDNLEYRNNMMLGSLFAGMAFSNASLGIVHAMAHSMGGLKNSPHGECNALLLEHCIDFNFNSAAGRYRNILEAMGTATAEMKNEEVKTVLCKKIKELRIDVGVEFTLNENEIAKSELYQLAVNAYNDACLATNPREASIEQIESIYEKIF